MRASDKIAQENGSVAAQPTEVDVMRVAGRLRPTLHRLARHLRREATAAGYSSVDVFILGLVKNKPGIGVSELARLENTTRPSMSAHVKRLVNLGWLAIDDSQSSDLRRFPLVLTPEGEAALAGIRESSNRWLCRQIAALPPEQQRSIANAVDALESLLVTA